MALLGRLAVDLIANTKKFESNMTKSTKKVDAFSKITKTASSTLKLFGVALSAGAFVQFARGQLQSLEALGLVSQKLDINVQRLQAYQFQATKAQISTNTLNTALQRMVRRVSEAAMGTGEAKNAIAELGLNAQNLARMQTDRQFETIAKAFQNIGNQGDRVRLAMRLFDTEGVSLVNLFADGVEKSRKEYEALGVAATKADVIEATKLQAEFATTMVELTAHGRRFVIDMSPHILEVVRMLRDLMRTSVQSGVPSVGTADGGPTQRRVFSRRFENSRVPVTVRDTGGTTTVGPQTPVHPDTVNAMREALGLDRQIY